MKITWILIAGIGMGIVWSGRMPWIYQKQLSTVTTEALAIPTATPTPKIDDLVDTYCSKYEKTRYKKNRCKVALHFLLLKEQNYGGSNNCGDSGKACGPLQFHEPTYQGYRKIMMKYGLVTEVGSRLDMEDAIETTAWAISDGRETAWGPIARGEIKL